MAWPKGVPNPNIPSFRGGHHTEEAREKMRVAALGNKRSLGLIRTPETRKRMSEAAERSARWTPELRERQRVRMLGNQHGKDARVLGECRYCGDPAKTMDHLTPRSRGGTNHPSNLVPACRPCNSSKNDRPMDEWRAHLEQVIARSRASLAIAERRLERLREMEDA